MPFHRSTVAFAISAFIAASTTLIGQVEDQAHPAPRMLSPSWPVWDQFYVVQEQVPVAFSRQRHTVLLSVDTDRTNLEGTSMKRGVDYPQSWIRDYGKGRVFYTSFGHHDDIWAVDPVFQAHVTGGIRWALGMEK